MNIATPFYILNKSKLKKLINEYKSIGEVYYPIKANDNELVVDAIINLSCCFEVDSIEHMNTLILHKGVNPGNLLYSFPIRDTTDIETAYGLGVKKFVVDSDKEFETISSIASDAGFFVRLNVADILSLHLQPQQNKWGMEISQAKELINTIKKRGNRVLGVSFYLFSEIANLDAMCRVLNVISESFSGFGLEYLNIGGGFSAYKLISIKSNLVEAQKSIGAKKIIIEPGAPLLNACIDMVVSIIGIKRIQGKRVIFINSGIYYGLIDIVIKNRDYKIVELIDKKNESKESTLICGSSSDVSDFLGEYELSSSLNVGDQLIIKNCGAYSAVMQTNFYKKKTIQMIEE